MLEKIVSLDANLAQELLKIDGIIGAIAVSTCNRFEVYAEARQSSLPEVSELIRQVQARLSENCRIEQAEIAEQTILFTGRAVSEHLFAVAAGLESVVIGETEIAGQVKRALMHAQQQRTTSTELERLFQRAAETARGIKTRTDVAGMGRSLVSLSLDLVDSRVGEWSAVQILLVGTGRYARTALASLRERGTARIQVYSPSGRGAEFAQKHQLELITSESLIAALANTDVLVACSAVHQPAISRAMIEQAKALAAALPARPRPAVCPVTGQVIMAPRKTPRHILIDLGLPRNLDPQIAQVPETDLIDLDTLRIHAPFEGLAAEKAARALVNRAANKFVAVGKEREVTPAIIAFRKHLEQLAQASQSRIGEGSEQVNRTLNHFIGSLMHTPLVRSRELAQRGEVHKLMEALSTLFDLEIDE